MLHFQKVYKGDSNVLSCGPAPKIIVSFAQIFWYELPLDNFESKLNSIELFLPHENTY